jgi:hypothetical protein
MSVRPLEIVCQLMTYHLEGGTVPYGTSRLLKNAHLRRFPHPLSLRRTSKYASLLRISGALHLGIFEQPTKIHFFSNLQEYSLPPESFWPTRKWPQASVASIDK